MCFVIEMTLSGNYSRQLYIIVGNLKSIRNSNAIIVTASIQSSHPTF